MCTFVESSHVWHEILYVAMHVLAQTSTCLEVLAYYQTHQPLVWFFAVRLVGVVGAAVTLLQDGIV